MTRPTIAMALVALSLGGPLSPAVAFAGEEHRHGAEEHGPQGSAANGMDAKCDQMRARMAENKGAMMGEHKGAMQSEHKGAMMGQGMAGCAMMNSADASGADAPAKPKGDDSHD